MYGSAAAFRIYNEERGREIPDAWTDAVIEAALLVASEWLDSMYSTIWIGTPTAGFTQENQWPRTDAITNTDPTYTFPVDEIPDLVVNATFEAAYREAGSPGSLSVDFTPSKYKAVRVEGAIQVEYRDYFQSSEVQTQITKIQNMMYPLIDPNKTGSGSYYSGRSVRV